MTDFMRPMVAICAAVALVWGAVPGAFARPVPASTVAAVQKCVPGGPCAYALPVRVVIVTMFEIGKDSGDAPGEFQSWKERRGLDTRIAFPQSWHDLWYNPQTQVLGMVTGEGSIRSASAVLALGLDQRFDVRQAYWLVAGIAGFDPHAASLGSAAWARYLVDGDLAHEIDAREIPPDWKTGYYPLSAKGPNDPTPIDPMIHGEMFTLNPALADWAYRLTRDMTLPDDPGLAAARVRYVAFPQARRLPFVLQGDNLSAMTFWHGEKLNAWAEDWVRAWTRGKGTFVSSAMEDTGTAQALTYLTQIHRADRDRLMVLRAGCNYTVPPPGVTAAANLMRESEEVGYSGMHGALESLYAVGSKVVDALLADWGRYAKAPPR